MADYDYDLLVIGAGPGGYVAAARGDWGGVAGGRRGGGAPRGR